MAKRKQVNENSAAPEVPEKRKKSVNEIKEGNAGIIEKITLQNFMCHSNLEFEFGPYINFIIGRNGSGKTAILNGIMLGLGGNSSDTGGCSNVQGFIQTNKQIAYITITLRNVGDEAYSPEVYGDRIIIERRLQRTGHGYYTLKSSSARVISSKKDDLNTILRHFNIQVFNPICVLTQNLSKNFLVPKDPTKDAKKKYEFSFKSTQVGTLIEDLHNMRKLVYKSAATIKTKQAGKLEMERQAETLRKNCKNIEKINSQKEKLSCLKNEKIWAGIREMELDQQSLKNERSSVTKKLKHEQEGLQKYQDKINDIDKDVAELKAKEEELKQTRKNEYTRKLNVLKRCQDLGNEVKYLEESKLKDLNLQIAKIEMRIHDLQNNINHFNQQSKEIQDQECENEIEFLEKLKVKDEIELSYFQKEIQKCESALCVAKEDVQNSIMAHDCNVRIGHEIDFKINDIKQKLQTQYARFGPKMQVLIQNIERSFFHKRPVGPIGLYLDLVDPKWYFAVETCLSRSLFYTFCCDNYDDTMHLNNLIKQIYIDPLEQRPSIHTCNFTDRVYSDVQQISPNTYLTVLKVIKCNNPIIVNCLIDMKFIESILLIEKSLDATNVMMYTPPNGCTCCYTLDGDLIYPARPTFRYYSCKKKYRSRSLFQSYTQADFSKAINEKQAIKVQIDASQNDLNIKQQNVRKWEDSLTDLKKKVHKINKKIQNYNEQQNEEREKQSQPDICQYEEELEHHKNLHHAHLNNQNAVNIELEKKKIEYAQFKKEEKLVKENFNKIEQEWCTLEDKLASKKHNKEIIEKSLHHHGEMLNKHIKELKLLDETYQMTKEKLKKTRNDQLKKGRIETNRRVADIQSEIEQIKNVIVQYDNANELQDAERLKCLQIKIQACQKGINKQENRKKELTTTIDQRTTCAIGIRSLVTLRVQYAFQTNMNSRGFEGELTFDHKNSTLVIKGQPLTRRKKKDVAISCKTDSLSGGERSFLTVSLLIALADASEMPFHIFDEYDVFMDEMNKKESLKLMLEKAKEQRKQFIFLSPLDYPSIVRDYSVKIHKMPDPERRQT